METRYFLFAEAANEPEEIDESIYFIEYLLARAQGKTAKIIRIESAARGEPDIEVLCVTNRELTKQEKDGIAKEVIRRIMKENEFR